MLKETELMEIKRHQEKFIDDGIQPEILELESPWNLSYVITYTVYHGLSSLYTVYDIP